MTIDQHGGIHRAGRSARDAVDLQPGFLQQPIKQPEHFTNSRNSADVLFVRHELLGIAVSEMRHLRWANQLLWTLASRNIVRVDFALQGGGAHGAFTWGARKPQLFAYLDRVVSAVFPVAPPTVAAAPPPVHVQAGGAFSGRPGASRSDATGATGLSAGTTAPVAAAGGAILPLKRIRRGGENIAMIFAEGDTAQGPSAVSFRTGELAQALPHANLRAAGCLICSKKLGAATRKNCALPRG